MNKLLMGKKLKVISFFLLTLVATTPILAQKANVAQIEEPRTGTEMALFFGLLLFALLAPAFKKREWPKLRKGYSYFID